MRSRLRAMFGACSHGIQESFVAQVVYATVCLSTKFPQVSTPMLSIRTLSFSLCLTTGCLHPVTQPQPRQVETALNPSEVVQRVAGELTTYGFEVTTVEPSAGVVSAKRVRSASAQGKDITCRFGPGSLNDSRLPVTLGVSVSARPVASRTEVIISTHTTMNDSDIDCASSGEVERRLLALVSRD